MQVLGFLARLGRRQCRVVANLNAAGDAAAVRANCVLKDPAHATLARAKAEAGDIVVEYDGVGFVRPPVCGQLLCRQSHLQHPFREGPGKKWEDIPVAGACGDQTVDLFRVCGG